MGPAGLNLLMRMLSVIVRIVSTEDYYFDCRVNFYFFSEEEKKFKSDYNDKI